MNLALPDSFDPESLRLPAVFIGDLSRRALPPRHRPGEPFLKGPIPFAWWAAACRLPGKALHVASAIRFKSGWQGPQGIKLGLSDMERSLGVKRDSARRGLRRLADAGLIALERPTHAKPVVSILELPSTSGTTQPRRPLYGPIPWAWWAAACRLLGRSLQVASALWLLVGWSGGKVAEFEFGLSEWSELGLTRFTAADSLRALKLGGLATAIDRIGRKPIVTLEGAPHRAGAWIYQNSLKPGE
jgi:hypothetical protein